ncbi:MAG: HypC/HybG/HupF family hydrogenase formation chaperone [Halothece sp. Uz-M2-17]|nr:HypC/HybG/HupF family hydrogenase formation chaperone [Halothece sp. Uz-M2-17]
MCLAVPGKIISITGNDPLSKMAKVSFSGVIQIVSLAYVPEAEVGDYVIVHVGFALNILDEKAAQQTLDDLAKLEPIL